MASHPLMHFRSEILKRVILPKLEGLLYESKGDDTISTLWESFRDKYSSTVSLREFKNWCSELHLKPKTQVVWEIPPSSTNTAPREPLTPELQEMMNIANTEKLRGALAADDFTFDNETKGDLQ